jgi:hypothetical protein
MREKSILIHPRSVHAHFHMSGFDYDTRKDYSIRIASKYISADILKKYERAHDITDSILFTMFFCARKQKELERKELELKRQEALSKFNKGLGLSINDFFNMYRYIPT